MRCLALALAAQGCGMRAKLIAQLGVPWVRERLTLEDVALTEVPGDASAREQPEALLAQLANEGEPHTTRDWVVLDGYHFGFDCQQAVRAAGYKLLVIDDYAHLPEYACDILLNQNIGAVELAYRGDIGQKLLGPKYALLRPEFIAARKKAEKRQLPEKIQNILLTLGGGDFSSHLARIASDFSAPELAGCTLRVIAGAMPPERIRELLQDCPANLEILVRVDDMPALLLDTDLCVTAGVSTCWELCCLGVPFLTVEVAANQRAIIRHLVDKGFAGIFTGNSFASALEEPLVQKDANKLRTFVDGKGCQKVLDELTNFPDLLLRKALPEDCMAVFALANDAQVRENALSTSRITEEEHVRWYAERVKLEGFYVAFFDNKLVGYVRYDKTDVREERIVTLAIAEEWRGKRLGARLLRESVQHVSTCEIDSVIAWVKPENIVSHKVFQQAGYSFLGKKQHQTRTMCCFQLRIK